MESKELTMMDLIVETHVGLERQGPGSPEVTLQALGFLGDLSKIARAADLACGTGGQTMVLAQNLNANITGLDLCPAFIDVFNANAEKLNQQNRVFGMVGDMEKLPFAEDEFDLIWCEGAIDGIGFEKGLNDWKRFLKKGGHIAVTCPSWFSDERPAEVEKLWAEASHPLDTIGNNIALLQRAGYLLVAAFPLPEICWTEHYFGPRAVADKALLEKYPRNDTVAAYIEENKYEAELYAKYKQYYGYVFYIGVKK
ncbi:MAG: class I SAM-dependent methyltransferase [Clostridiales bacterium]|nr:class I SAM-dependent methyltransferase [Clostridiales bacterium]